MKIIFPALLNVAMHMWVVIEVVKKLWQTDTTYSYQRALLIHIVLGMKYFQLCKTINTYL